MALEYKVRQLQYVGRARHRCSGNHHRGSDRHDARQRRRDRQRRRRHCRDVRLVEAFREAALRATEVGPVLTRALTTFIGEGRPLDDDLSLVALHWTG